MDNLHFILKEMGLTDKEIKLYFFLLTNSCASAGVLANRLHIRRSSCYSMLEKLTRKGFVSQIIKKNTQFFFPVDPLIWMENIGLRQSLLLKKIEKAKDSIQSNNNRSALGMKPSRALFFIGKEGILHVLMDLLAEKPNPVRALVSKDLDEFIRNKFPHFQEIRSAKNIFAKAMHTFEDSFLEYKRSDEKYSRKTILLDECFAPKMNVLIYNHKIAMISINEDFALITESAILAEEYGKIFDMAWDMAEKQKIIKDFRESHL